MVGSAMSKLNEPSWSGASDRYEEVVVSFSRESVRDSDSSVAAGELLGSSTTGCCWLF